MKRPFRKRNTERAQQLRRESSPAERRLWDHLNKSQLDGWKFTRQYQIGPFFGDFVCRTGKLVVELDGFSHEMSSGNDASRTAKIQAEGYEVIRFTNDQVFKEIDGVLTSIKLALSNRPTPGPSRLREGRCSGADGGNDSPPASGRG